MKKIAIVLAILFVLSFPFSVHAQITKDQYYARSTLEGNELEFYDERYDSFSEGDTERHSNFGLSDDRAAQIAQYVWNDAPELFRRSNFYTDEEAAEYQKQIDQKTDEILSLLTDDMTDYEKVKTLYDYLATHIDYGVSEEAGDEGQTIVGSLVYGKAVCGGITKALEYMLHQIDIPCYTVDGEHEGGPHSWNIIQLDGQWYNADLTDDLGYPNSVFLYGDSIFAGSHIPDPELNPPLPECPENYVETPKTIEPTPAPTVEKTPAPVVANVEPQEPPGGGGNYTGWIIAIAAIGAIVAGITARNRKKRRT